MKTARQTGLIAALLLLALAGVLAFNTLRLDAEPLADRPAPAPELDQAAVGRLAAALRIPTISSGAGPPPAETLAAFAAHLERSFPRVHAGLVRERIGGGSLLYTWPGRDPQAPALLLAAHMDVVPIDAGSESKWTQPPFSGAVAGGFVWGRGAIDDKASLMAILEAVERSLERGFRPPRTVYLAFGHDEEIGGGGARAIAALLQGRGASIGLALDEGFAVVEGVVPGVEPPVALIGVGEKGYLSVELTAAGAGGHSSAPTGDNAAVRIARAVGRVADHPMAARIDGVTAEMLDAVAPYTGGATQVALANRWLFDWLVERRLLANPATAPSIRTTTAPTILRAGTKDNVLPQRARAVINHRILPGDTVDEVIAHDRKAIDDERVSLRALPLHSNPGTPASTDSAGYRLLRSVVRDSFPNAVIAPGLVLGATDGRHYQGLARTVLRFAPLTFGKDDLARYHGNDERVGVADYMRAIRFYERLIQFSPERVGGSPRD